MSEREQNSIENDGIVSVNSRGAQSSRLAKKIGAVATVLGVLIVGGVYSAEQWNSTRKAHDAEVQRAKRVEVKAEDAVPKHNFAAESEQAKAMRLATVPVPSPTPAPVAVAPAPPCKPVTLTDATGVPMLSINGAPITVGCDGKAVTTAQAPPVAAPPVNPYAYNPAAPMYAPGTMQPATLTTNGPAVDKPKVVSRYRGGILLAAAPVAPGAAPEAPPAAPTIGPGAPVGPMPVVLQAPGASTVPAAGAVNATPNQQGAVAPLLNGTATARVSATMLGDRHMILPKGAHIECAMTVKVVNEVSGFASCIVPSDVYSDDGKVVVIEKGSAVEGTYQAGMKTGQRRLFILWETLKTPNGVLVALDSPATDGLGTMGVDGVIDNHWWDRLGAAILLSIVQDGIAYEIAKASNGANSTAGGTAYSNTSRAGQDMTSKILESTIGQTPTLFKHQGDLAAIYVARNVDFSNVYALRTN